MFLIQGRNKMLSVRSGGDTRGGAGQGVPLDGHLLARVEGACQHDAAKGAVAQLVQQLVPLHRGVPPLHAGEVPQGGLSGCPGRAAVHREGAAVHSGATCCTTFTSPCPLLSSTLL